MYVYLCDISYIHIFTLMLQTPWTGGHVHCYQGNGDGTRANEPMAAAHSVPEKQIH